METSEEHSHANVWGSLWCEARLAASFLTIVPMGVAGQAPNRCLTGSFAFFPLIGFLIGATLVIEDFVLTPVFKAPIRSVGLVLSLALLTGCVHLDGLADAADAFGARGDRQRALDVMRDSRVGVYGAVALFFVLIVKCAALTALDGWTRRVALYAAPGLSRWAMVATSEGLKYLRAEGAGGKLLAPCPTRFARAGLMTLGALLPVICGPLLIALGAVVLLALAAKAFYRRWLGGVTGDLLGAVCELSEALALVIFCAAA